jgi:hypothetical protein
MIVSIDLCLRGAKSYRKILRRKASQLLALWAAPRKIVRIRALKPLSAVKFHGVSFV